MNVGELRSALKDLPDDVNITIDMGLGYEWERMKKNWEVDTERSKKDMLTRGLNPDVLDEIEGPYKTLNRSGLPADILFQGVSDLDLETNSVRLEL